MEEVLLQLDEAGHDIITRAILGDYSLLVPFAEYKGDMVYSISPNIVSMTLSYSVEQLNMYEQLLASGSSELNVENLLADNRGFIALHILQSCYLAWMLAAAANNTVQPPAPTKTRRTVTEKKPQDVSIYVASTDKPS